MLNDILEIVVPILVPAVLTFLAPYARTWLRANTQTIAARAKTDKRRDAIWQVEKTIEDCVIATNQTYVEALKKEDAFTKEAQLEAFSKTANAILKIVTAEARDLISESVEDFSLWLQIKIEKAVNKAKG